MREAIGGAKIVSKTYSSIKGYGTIEFASEVTAIESKAFNDQDNLTYIALPNSVTSIGDMAFFSCTDLKSVTIGNSMARIGDEAFCFCSALCYVYCYAESAPATGRQVFDNSLIARATLHVPASSIDSYKASAPWSGFGKIIALTEEETGINELKDEDGKLNSASTTSPAVVCRRYRKVSTSRMARW